MSNQFNATFTSGLIYGWIFSDGSGNLYTFNSGYSALSLIGLYVLARYLRIFVYERKKDNLMNKVFQRGIWFPIWAGIVIFDVMSWTLMTYMGIGQISSRIFTYTSPMIIIQSISMFMCFKNMRMRTNRFINWLGASSLAVLIVHGYLGCEPFLSGVRFLYLNYSGVLCLVVMSLFMFSVFMVAVIIDQVRIFFWNRVSTFIPDIRI